MTRKHRRNGKRERAGTVLRLPVLSLIAVFLAAPMGIAMSIAAHADIGADIGADILADIGTDARVDPGALREIGASPLTPEAGRAKFGWRIVAEGADGAAEETEAQEEAPAAEVSGEEDNGGEPRKMESGGADGGEQPLPEIITDLGELPFPARKMRDLILQAALSGDVEKLRPYLGYGDDVTMLSLGGHEEDPIEFLKSLSGDPDGHEILAIMTEILEAPLVKTEPVPGEVVYVWPYFYAYPFDKLTPEQRVGMYRIITHGDYEEMVQFGSYIFYRLGITPEGRWRFFVAGD